MSRRIGIWSLLVGAALMPAMVGGCPEGQSLLGQLGLDPSSVQGQLQNLLSDEAVFKVLADVVESELPGEGQPAGQDEPVSTGDEPQNFGEDGTLFSPVSGAANPSLPAQSVLDDAAPLGGQVAVGTLAGTFLNDIPDSDSTKSGGVFRGSWMDDQKNVLGLVRGEYRPLSSDRLPEGLAGGGVFWGKYIGNDGKFRGILRGRYGQSSAGKSLFVGRWMDRKERRLGLLKGEWLDDASKNGGTFAGRWAAYSLCNEVDQIALNETGETISSTEVALLATPPAQAAAVADGEAVATEDPAAQASGTPCIDLGLIHGYMRGRWTPLDPNLAGDGRREFNDGTISGEWRDADNNRVGTFAGFYENKPAEDGNDDQSGDDDSDDANSNSNDNAGSGDSQATHDMPGDGHHERRIDGRFIATVTNDAGETIGYIRGLYGKSVNNVGIYRGRFFNTDLKLRGKIGGRWAPSPDQPGGTLVGMWGALTAQLAPPPARPGGQVNGSDGPAASQP
ncbi:MAG: hypothetical protein U1D55_14765 [Phycisphaerae bacterium]